MNDPKLQAAVIRWFVQRVPLLKQHEEDLTAARIEMDPGYRYSSCTYENASVNVIIEGEDGLYFEYDLDTFWPDGKAKLGEFVEQVVALAQEAAA